LEENARWGDVGFFIFLHSRLVGPYIGTLGTDEQKERWLPKCVSGENVLAIAMTEPGTGSDVSGIRTRAEDKGDHYLLNGSKTFISNGILADLVIVAAKTDPNSSHGLSLFVVERGMEGFERGKNLKKMGLHSQDTAELFFNNVKVPKENLLGEFNRGFYHLMHFLAEERLLSAVGSLANAEAAFAVTLEYASERQVFGQKVADFQVNRFKFADMRTEMDIAQAFIDRCVMVHNAGELTAEDAAKAKLYATELEDRVTDQCVQLHGGNGYMEEYAVSRMYTAARVSRIYAGSSEIMREIIARSIGLDPRKKTSKKDAA
jgi:acyl-CoA dehydrogenase